MNGNQMMLVLFTGTMLTAIVFNLNGSILNSAELTSENEFFIAANSIAEARISEIASKAFDASVSGGNDVTDIGKFTAPHQLGHGSWESYPDFNDVDDFNNFSNTVMVPRAGEITVSSTVSYVQQDDLNSPVMVRTRIKRVEVRVHCPFLKNDVVMYHYASY